jgi:outer membrane protein
MNFGKILILTVTLFFSFSGFSQQKIGHIDMERVIKALPEFETAQDSLDQLGKDFEKNLIRERQKLENYYSNLMQKMQSGELTPLQQDEEDKKLGQMKTELDNQVQMYDQKLAFVRNQIMGEIQARIEDALIIYGRENDFTYILDKNQILYFGGGIDVTDKIIESLKKK